MRKGVILRLVVVCMLCLTACGCKAGRAYNKGVKAYKNEAFEEALGYFDTALSLNPNKAEYYIEQGKTLLALARYEKAREAFSRAVVESDMELVRKNNKRANAGIGISYFQEGNYEKAEGYLEKAKEEPLLPEWDESILIYLTDTCRMLGKREQALELYAQWLTAEKGKAEDFYHRGMLLQEEKDYEGSLKDFEQAILMDAKEYSFYFGKMNALGALGRENERAEVIRQTAALAELPAEEMYYLAKELAKSGSTGAEGLLERSVENGFTEANYFLGELFLKKEDYARAAVYYQRYIAADGKEDGFAYNQLAVCQTAQEEYEAALQTVGEGLKVCTSKNEEELLYNKIVILERLGEFRTAYENAARFSEMFPENEKMRQELEYLKLLVN